MDPNLKGGLLHRQPKLLDVRASVEETHSEYQQQAALIEWARWSARLIQNDWPRESLALKWLHAVPNGLFLSHDNRVKNLIGQKAVAAGLTKGVYDLRLDYSSLGYNGAYIEMKAGKNKLSVEQEEFRAAMAQLGYFTIEAWSWHDAARRIVSYMTLKGNYAPIPPR